MKRKLIQETLIYCIFPIVAIALFYGEYKSTPWIVLIIGVLYALNVKSKENRINYTYLTFLFLFNIYFISINSIGQNMIVQFNLIFMLLLGILILILESIDINVCEIVLRDLLVIKGESKVSAYKISKRSKINSNLKRLSTIIIIELLCCDLIAIYYINIMNMTKIENFLGYEILVVILFTLIEAYQISAIKDKITNTKVDTRRFVKQNMDLGKVINLEQYR